MYKVAALAWILVLGSFAGCGGGKRRGDLAVESKMEKARRALEEGKTYEARRETTEVLAMKPESVEAQRLMAEVIEREAVRERELSEGVLPEELTGEEKALGIKTWLERAQGHLELNQLEEALQAAEQVFRLDAENLEASRLVDEIKEKAKEQGNDENQFLEGLYEEEIQKRIERYVAQTEAAIAAGQLGTARLTIEKLLLLDPKNARGKKLSSVLDEKEKDALITLPHPPQSADEERETL